MRGHIRKRGTTWSIVIDLGRDSDGRRRQKWHSGFKTKREAEHALGEILGKIQAGTYIQGKRQTVAEYLTEWLPAIRSTVRSGTWTSYRANLEHHVIPRIGHLQLAQLSARHLNAMYAELEVSGRVSGGPLSRRTVKYTHTILHRALRDAVRWNLLVRNPADQSDPPSPDRPEMRVWTNGELNQFLRSTRDSRLHALWILWSTTGLRRGEALALRWSDVDLEAGRLAIRRSLSSVGGTLSFARPKTAKSRRPVVLDPKTLAALRDHRERQEKEKVVWDEAYKDLDLVFAREDGSALRPDSLSRWFQAQASRIGLEPIRLHDLRHTYATVALSAGTHPKVVAERLGHSTTAVTLDIYSHVVPSLEEQEAERIADLILGDDDDEDRDDEEVE